MNKKNMWLVREKDGYLYLFENKPEYGCYLDDSGDNVSHFTGWHTNLDVDKYMI